MSLKQLAPLLAAIGTAVCLCAAVGVFHIEPPPEPVQSVMAPTQVPEEPTTEQPAAQESTPPTEPAPPPTEPAVEPYDFTQPAPEREAVEKDYFADAAFVGDSRTDGFMLYSGIGTGTGLTSNGLSIFRLESKKALKIAGEEYTLLEALSLKEYGKVYLCLGINELGIYNDEGFYQSYLSAIDAIRAAQPNAIIYIQGLIPLNEEERFEFEGKTDLTNDHLRVYNELMRKAAEEKQVVYLDLYSEFVDENGSLPAGASRDGVHLNREYCQRWLAYLQTHTVDPEALGIDPTENEETEPQ